MLVIYAVVHVMNYMKRVFTCQVFLLYRIFYAPLRRFIICEREKNSAPKTDQRINRIYEGKSNEQSSEGIGTNSSNVNIIERMKPSTPKIIMSMRPSIRENFIAANDV